MKVNHFLAQLPDKELNHYDVMIRPKAFSRSISRFAIAEQVRIYKATKFDMKFPAYNGRKSTYTIGFLLFNSTEFVVMFIEECCVMRLS